MATLDDWHSADVFQLRAERIRVEHERTIRRAQAEQVAQSLSLGLVRGREVSRLAGRRVA